MNVQPSDGDLDAAEFAHLLRLAQDAATAALCHRRARLRFHGFEITARRHAAKAQGFEITLTLRRDSRPVAQKTVFIPHA